MVAVGLAQGEGPLRLPYPAFAAYGNLQIADLDSYMDAGLNVAYVSVAPPLPPEAHAALLDFLAACEKRSLPVVVEIADIPPAENLRVSPFSRNYATDLEDYVVATVSVLKSQRAICAWATPPELSLAYTPNDGDLRATLLARYQSLDALEKAWGRTVRRWESVTVAGATGLDPARPCGLGPSALDYADYRATTYRGLVSLWLESIGKADITRPMLLGRESSRAAVASLPDRCEAVIAGSPGELIEAWPDALTPLHTARRGGRRQVLLSIPTTGEVFGAAGSVLKSALMFGADGFMFEDWKLVKTNALLRRAIADAQAAADAVGGRPFAPRTHVAVLHQPYADGTVLQDGRGLYGFLSGLSPGEPSRLLSALSGGHRFGSVDVIGREDLVPALLGRYRVVFAPMAFDLGAEALHALIGWVNAGGILVLDLGAGMRQTGSILLLPPGLDMLTGAPRLGRVADAPTDLVIVDAPPPLEGLPIGATARGIPPFCAFSGAVGDALLSLDARLIADAGGRRGPDGRMYQTGIVLNAFGAGACIFATAPMFATWGVGDPVFMSFMDNLLTSGALIEAEPASGQGLFAKEQVVTALQQGHAVLNLAEERALVRLLVPSSQGGLYEGLWRLTAASGVGGPDRAELLASVEPGALKTLCAAPVSVEAPGWVQLVQYRPDLIEVKVRSERARVSAGRDGTVTIKPRGEVKGSLRVRDGRYPVSPGSRHRITITGESGTVLMTSVATADRSQAFEVVADDLGATLIVVPED